MIPKDVDIDIEKYRFIYDGTVKVDFKDNHVIDLDRLNIISVCITLEDTWIVNLITKEALYKYKEEITETLETVGFRFEEYMNAILAHNFLTLYILSPETASFMEEVNDIG